MKILLVEPSYKNSYPPLGLMKIATFHTSRGDQVYFIKGTKEIELDYERIYITNLFTFHFDLTIKTINYYNNKYKCKIYVGGIASSIMYDKFRDTLNKEIIILKGLLTSSSILGYNDNINIDQLDADYNILSQIDYKYKTEEGFIAYTSRGCVNKCSFCAVPKLEPEFCVTNNLVTQIKKTSVKYGEKRNLLLLDNNILAFDLENLQKIVDSIVSLGFTKGAKFFAEYEVEALRRKIEYLKEFTIYDSKIVLLQEKMIELILKRIPEVNNLTNLIKSENKTLEQKYSYIIKMWKPILNEFRKRDRRRGQERVIDFNQGMDARLLTEDKMKILSVLPIKPFRLAFDHLSLQNQYCKSIRLAAKFGVKYFSNYLLYNYEDDYIDLYRRMEINIKLASELNVNIHSFPMKYAPIHLTHRNVIGKKWNKYYLSNFRRILKPTMGVVGVGESYFYNAFGHNEDEFKLILSMPYDLLTYREFFKANGITDQWKRDFKNLSNEEVLILLRELSNSNYNYKADIMKFYRIRKNKESTWNYLL